LTLPRSQQSSDEKPESESFLLPNVLKVGACKEKKMCDERALLGMKKRNFVFQCLEVCTPPEIKLLF
jgi:hypothetical protein